MEIVETTQPVDFRFREDFLGSYRAMGDPFKTLLARSTYLTKYCREMESGKKETWTDTIRRVVEGNVALAPRVSRSEAETLFHLFWTGQALPPGRGLWVGGINGIPADARFNCFSAETRFWANGTITSFEEAVGQTVEVLAGDGQWRPASVQSFGKQKLFRYRVQAPGRSLFAFDFTATANHRWFTTNRGEVTDLKVGDRVQVGPVKGLDQDQTGVYQDGFAHGFVFGDGSKETLKEDIYRLRLCGEKDWQHEGTLMKAKTFHNASRPPSFRGDPLLFFKSPKNLKELPSDSMGNVYLAGFLAGWMAADGSMRSDGRGGNRLASQNADALDWVAERAPLLGFCVTGRSMDPITETNFGVRHNRLEVLTLVPESVEYTVREVIDEGREEEVYCVVEPETRSFTLAGGVVTGNCWYTTLYNIEDWCWTANQLMLGGGVGVGLGDIKISMPIVSGNPSRLAVWCNNHPDAPEVKPEGKEFLNGSTPVLVVPDSREGWVEALRTTLVAAFEGRDQILDLSGIRPRGAVIKTFGGVACGPGPLAHMIRETWKIVRQAAGRRLTSVEALDITNHIGLCIKSGNVRRSALIVLGDAHDQDFRDAKKDFSAVQSHRHTSNNSIVFRTWDEVNAFDWRGLVHDNIEFGEPGILNLALGRQTDPGAMGVNPCGEQLLHDREACNLAEVFPAQFETGVDSDTAFRLVTRYCLRQRLTPLSDPQSHAVGTQNMRIGVGLGGICDFDWKPEMLATWFTTCRTEADSYAGELKVASPITVTTVKPSGTISLLNGSSPGQHAPHSPYYIRRTRIAKNDPMAMAMMEAGVRFEEDIYDKSGHTWVFEFPMKAPHDKISAETENIRDQFERQKTVQTWWADNAVSATLNFDPETEREELASCLEEYIPHLKSTACLPKTHGYEQAPYEAISKDHFDRLYAEINHDHPLVADGDIDVGDCVGGICPIK